MVYNVVMKAKEKLVSYRNFPYGLKRDGLFNAIPLSQEKFESLKSSLEYEHFDNNYMPRIYLQITGRCNLKCKHCFSAIDNNPLVTQLSLTQIKELFKQARDCGVFALIITGGEPTVHPELIDILKCARENDLFLLDFNTNGFDLKEEVLDCFKELNFDPNIKISLDGIGKHDEFRGVKGSQERALKALELCKEKGFRIYSQTQVNKQTYDTLPALLDRVENMDLISIRLIKTTSTPRWQQNGQDDNFTFKEYYQKMYELLQYSINKGYKTPLDIWSLGHFYPQHLSTSFFDKEKVRDGRCQNYLCSAYHSMISIACDGNIYPCLEMQGIVNALGYTYGNIKESQLKDILNGGKYYDIQQYTRVDRINHNQQCQQCDYQEICQGGCPGLGMIYSNGDYLGIDQSCCQLFKSGMYEKFKKLIDDSRKQY